MGLVVCFVDVVVVVAVAVVAADDVVAPLVEFVVSTLGC